MLFAVAALLAVVICAPLFGGGGQFGGDGRFGGYLLFRDAVSVPDFSLTAAAFGIDGSAPRAVPQDAALGVLSAVVDGGLLVAVLTTLAVFGAGIGYGSLALRLVPSAGRAGAVTAATVAIWNPFVAERLLQGQWSLLLGYAALGPIVLAVLRLAEPAAASASHPRLALAALFAVAGFTPTGSVLAAVTAAVAAVAARLSWRRSLATACGWLVTASPWLVGAAVSSASASSSGASAFALRAEPGLGSLGTASGLGGIWNADAVPTSRTTWWAAVATAAFGVLVGAGCVQLWRRGAGRVIRALALLAAVTVLLVVLAATGPGLATMDVLLTHVPGAGLLRDTQKYLAVVMPFAAVASAAAIAWWRRWVPAGLAVAAAALLAVAPMPDLAWGVGGEVRSVSMPSDYAEVAKRIGADRSGRSGTVAIWPTSTVRRLSWTTGPSLSPLPRMVDAPVVTGGALVVDGEELDAPTGRDAQIVDALNTGADPRRLADLGVGWVIVEEADPPAGLTHGSLSSEAFAGEHLRLYRIDDARPGPAVGTAAWVAAIAAFALWGGALVLGTAAWLVAAVSRRRAAGAAGD